MDPAYLAGWLGFRTILRLYFRARYFNPENVPRAGPVILASNHASYLDPPLVGCGLPRQVAMLARDSLFRFPVMGTVLRSWGTVPVDRDGGGAAGLRIILDRLMQGNAILLFPEGTRTNDGAIRAARSGIGLIVIKSSAPIVPVRVFGTFESYGRHIRFPRPHPVAVKYGVPIDFSVLREETATCSKSRLKEIYQEIANQVMLAIGSLKPFEDKRHFP
jgi:1-acyl-sn-glycerol-3-phosphate acyltransferase